GSISLFSSASIGNLPIRDSIEKVPDKRRRGRHKFNYCGDHDDHVIPALSWNLRGCGTWY
ncbi:hypothetical protein AB4187_10060, partial [Vibrio breoganii]